MISDNIWLEFEKLLPKRGYTIGTVTSVDSIRGISVVTLISGDAITAKGTSIAAGKNCIILDGIIQSEAPDLNPMLDLEIAVL